MDKRKFLILLTILTSLIVVTVSWAAPENTASLPAKQIAAPPSEFDSLSLPDPASAGVRSHSAMVPVHLEQAKDSLWTWQGEILLDSGVDVSLMVLAPEIGAWSVTAETAAGRSLILDEFASRLGIERQVGELGMGDNGHPGEVFHFERIEPGVLTVDVTAEQPRAAGSAAPDGYIVVSGDSPYRIFTHLNTYDLLVGNEVGLVTYAYHTDYETEAPLSGVIETAQMRLALPDGQVQHLPMFDDGRHADGLAGDGVFGGLIDAAVAGEYTAQVTVQGQTYEGQPFLRTSQHLFPVLAPRLTLSAEAAQTAVVDHNRLQINLKATALAEATENVQVFAEVWGQNSQQEMVPVAWIGGVVSPQLGQDGLTLPLTLDGRWAALAGAQSDFELRHVRVQDLNTHIPLAQLDQVALTVPRLPRSAYSSVETITDDMLMGPRPEQAVQSDGFAGVVMLIHGYCSGGNTWPLSHFTAYGVFHDPGQNRTHDQFAQLIGSFGSQYPSFGAVAHSQGGDASLHLYTYYWSGLDYSSGNRLIQSVGTPYQGTSLAGDLAILGEIFGVGCGTNWDLSYNGAALWLSNIPGWARSRVYYSTTSFDDVWWRYDYCNILSDLLLDDPDDGVVERWAGQLSGANNMGHKEDWCHTSGMRDPAQTGDYSRNVNMNANANR